MPRERLVVGAVGRPHGVRGGFRVEGAVDWWEFRATETIVLAGVERLVTACSGEPARPILQLDGIDSRDQVEALRGASLEIAAARAPALEEDAFWVADLVGCEVLADGLSLGAVREVLERPANDVLVVTTADGGELLLPFTRDAVPAVDVSARRIEVRGDLLEPPASP